MGATMAAKDVVLRARQAHIRDRLNKRNVDLAVEKRVGMELADELGSVQRMVREPPPIIDSSLRILT